MERRYLDVAQLPPRPDLVTGLPRPVHAPWYTGYDVPADEDWMREHDPALAPAPPPGQGPVLAWYKLSRSGTVIGTILAGVVLAGLGALIVGLDVFTSWGGWIVLAVAMLVMYLFGKNEGYYSAGAEWFAMKNDWVRLYELVKVVAIPSARGMSIWMKDSAGHEIDVELADLGTTDRLIWDLIYNGIVHSVIAGGAETNPMLHRQLTLPYPQSARNGDTSDGESSGDRPTG